MKDENLEVGLLFTSDFEGWRLHVSVRLCFLLREEKSVQIYQVMCRGYTRLAAK